MLISWRALRSSAPLIFEISLPATVTVPSEGSSSPFSIRIKVLFPAPL
ncbi:Uncharacterised protein [Mycobacteroides abscessus subsp. abscessus]|nr:Uncharacterised protein [Mycobacteroides abscessus subsp. abscessus]